MLAKMLAKLLYTQKKAKSAIKNVGTDVGQVAVHQEKLRVQPKMLQASMLAKLLFTKKKPRVHSNM